MDYANAEANGADYANTGANGMDYANIGANGADYATSESHVVVYDEIELEPQNNDASTYEQPSAYVPPSPNLYMDTSAS